MNDLEVWRGTTPVWRMPPGRLSVSISGTKLTAKSGPLSLGNVTPFLLRTVNILGIHKIMYL